ncbi:CFEM domain-containing protein [Colletotrichum higginsianum]|nr:CFEM domain-containing protein [Colletotrichum higginsianum]
MRQSMLIGLMVAFFRASQASLLDYAGKLPECGLNCTLEQIPLSACKVVSNDTCICSDEKLRASVQACLLERCKRLEAIDVARIEAEACKRPVRNRKVDIIAPIVIQALGALAVPLRLYARWTTMHRFESDDLIMIFCGIFFIDESFYLACLGLTKISVLFFYLRIFPNKSFRRATYAAMTYIGLSTTIMLFMQIFQCIPFSFNWDGWKGDFGPHHCLNINVLAFVAGGLSISHDIIILFLPVPLLWHLNMGLRSKIGIFIMFSLGIFILITSCVRLQYIALFTRSLNPTWDFTDPLIWSGIEVSVSMIVVCLPATRVLWKRSLPRCFSSIATLEFSPPKRESSTSSRVAQYSKSNAGGGGGDHRSNEQSSSFDRKAAAAAAARRIAERRKQFFSFRSTNVEPSESELELGDKVRGEVRTQIRRRGSIESGIHVRTTTTFEDLTGEARGKPFFLP